MTKLLFLFTKRWFWLLLVGVVIVFLMWRNWPRIKSILRQRGGDFQPQSITEERKAELQEMAKDTWSVIHLTASEHSIWEREKVMEQLNAINDSELFFVAKFYKKELNNGTPLYVDVNNEVMWFSSTDNKLLSALERIGQV